MNKKKLLAPLFVAASFMLVACSTSEIVARPSWIDDPIVIVNGEKITDNNLKAIYDAVKKLGDTNSNVLNKVMYEIAQKQLGTFEEIKTLATKAEPTDDEINAFVAKYPVYKSEDIGWKKGETNPTTLTDAQKKTVSHTKIKDQYTRIKESIFESLYNDVKGGDYCSLPDKKLFQEQYFIDHLKDEMYWPKVDAGITPTANKEILPKKTGQTWEEYVNYNPSEHTGFLNVINSSGEFTRIYYPTEMKDTDEDRNPDHYDGGYIGRKILPEIYRTLLIENYVREQRYTNLGRSYARKVKMLTVPYSNDPTIQGNILAMLNYFVTSCIGDGTTKKIDTNYNLDYINDAMIGFAWNAPQSVDPDGIMVKANELLNSREIKDDGNFEQIKVKNGGGGTEYPLIWQVRTKPDGSETETVVNSYVYKGTKLGDLVEKYLLTQDVTFTGTPDAADDFHFSTKDHFTSEAQTAYDDITNNKAYDLDTGLIVKEREIRLTDMTTDGWFLKNGGLTDLKDEFRNKLFNIKTSSILDDEGYISGDTKPKSDDPIQYYGDNTNRIAFVRDEGKLPNQQIVLNDMSSNFYIVEVDEAASASKLSTTDLNRSYLKLKADATDPTISNGKMDEIVKEVTKQVSNSDTYKKNAEQYYLMISNILFYDQSVYDYFKSQFPELFK